jgi:hypothetical protein
MTPTRQTPGILFTPLQIATRRHRQVRSHHECYIGGPHTDDADGLRPLKSEEPRAKRGSSTTRVPLDTYPSSNFRFIAPMPAATFKPVLPSMLTGCGAIDLSKPEHWPQRLGPTEPRRRHRHTAHWRPVQQHVRARLGFRESGRCFCSVHENRNDKQGGNPDEGDRGQSSANAKKRAPEQQTLFRDSRHTGKTFASWIRSLRFSLIDPTRKLR